MARSRSHTRRRPRSNPRGVLTVRGGGFGFVQTAEGAYFVPASKMAGAFDGDLVEVAPLPPSGGKGGAKQPHQGGSRSGDQPAARVLRVLDRAHDTIVGRYEVAEPFGVVVPEDARIPYDIFTMRADHPDVEDGSLVRVRITAFPSRNTAATGVVEEVIGRAGDEDLGVDLIVARHKLETAFSEGALAEARAAVLDEDGALAEGYRDLRGRFTFTIDPADARDFDDALSLERVSTDGTALGLADAQSLGSPGSHGSPAGASGSCGTRLVGTREPEGSKGVVGAAGDAGGVEGLRGSCVDGERAAGENGSTGEASGVGGCGVPAGVRFVDGRGARAARWRLGVHIADVSHYVLWNSSIDLDARRRATSVYLVDRVIPMLPEELSGDLCSLRPGEARRAMTADLYLDGEARLVGYELYPALIRSDARLTYDEAQTMLSACQPTGNADAAETFADVGGSAPSNDSLAARLAVLSRIAKRRAAAREAAGGLDFDTTEAKVRLDDEGHPVAIDLRRKTEATSLVEEAMILANETVARHLRDAKFPGIFRVHDKPSADSLAALVPVFQEFAWFGGIDQNRLVAGDPHVLAQVLDASAGRPEGELVSTLVLRSMKRAVYRPACEPHYGLASEAYAHFTSPIRRYPDLVVHRMLKAQLRRRPERFDQEVAALPWIAEHSSDMERVAEKAARESQELKIVEYMERAVGQAFPAVVSGVANYGVYVRLENTAEGLVPLKNLGREYFSFDPVLHRLTGQDSGAVYRLGQRLPVVLTSADPRAGRLDFRPAREER
ncbi:3'-5' exonuclease [Gordonibacter sp. 28C]|uniref:ribonuclease R family protein n=1 Tax=Gordonibacter sp. 28C TaxID=2078569 RepID=UPI000DF7D9F3|nr:VacB/RNase II family 3'-5' exoribonuclease [Gordonibacter sp. 28C]RDB60495.1 3'-5' exonuclease [Gordonibacter sp. 28C]